MNGLQTCGRFGRKWVLYCAVAGISLAMMQKAGFADESPAAAPSSQQYISREEYDRKIGELLRQQEQMRKELDDLKRAREAAPAVGSATTQPAAASTTPSARPASGEAPATSKAIADLRRDVRDLHDQVDRLPLYRPGSDQFLIAGAAAFGFSAVRHSSSSFDAGIAPLILIRPADRVLIEAAADGQLDFTSPRVSPPRRSLALPTASLSTPQIHTPHLAPARW